MSKLEFNCIETLNLWSVAKQDFLQPRETFLGWSIATLTEENVCNKPISPEETPSHFNIEETFSLEISANCNKTLASLT